MIGNTGADFVDKRKRELQLYLEVLGRHPYYKSTKPLRVFLTYEKTEEFEEYKAHPKQTVGKDSLVVSSLKNMQLKDTVSIIYSLVKSKLVSKEEPAEVQSLISFDEILKKIDKYVPLHQASAKILEEQICFQRKYLQKQEELPGIISDGRISEYYQNHVKLLNVCRD